MSYPIEKKFVIAVSSSALFDMQESNKIFKEKGETEYRLYQEQNIDKPFDKGVAFPFISRLLHLNEAFIEEQPIEIILLSKNSPESGLRAMRTIAYYGLNITRACFSSGRSNFQYLPAFNASLFLSDDPEATRENLLILDATTGKNAVSQAEEFSNITDMTGIILTKMDSTARGGISITIADEYDMPIKFIGMGEGMDDLIPFDANEFVEGIFDE